MIFVDANILLYAEDTSNSHHQIAKNWWDEKLSGDDPVYLCWAIISAFIRLATSSRIFLRPMTVSDATQRVESWFEQPPVRLAVPTKGHWKLFSSLLTEGQATGNLVTDAHLAALAIQYGCTLYSSDADFSRFSQLKWCNPLK